MKPQQHHQKQFSTSSSSSSSSAATNSQRKRLLTVKTFNDQEKKKLTQELARLTKQQKSLQTTWLRDYDQVKNDNTYANLYLTDSVIQMDELTCDPIYTSGHANVDKCALDLAREMKQREKRIEKMRNEKAKQFLISQQQQQQQNRTTTTTTATATATTSATATTTTTCRAKEILDDLPNVPCQWTVCGQYCKHFPCILPKTYQFMGEQRQQVLSLFHDYAIQMPDYKKHSLASIASDIVDIDAIAMKEHSEIIANQRVTAFHPVERAKALKLQHYIQRQRLLEDIPPPRQTLYGRPYPRRKSVKSLWMK